MSRFSNLFQPESQPVSQEQPKKTQSVIEKPPTTLKDQKKTLKWPLDNTQSTH